MPRDLFPGGLALQVGMNSIENPGGRWGVFEVTPDHVPNWPSWVDDERVWTYNRIAWAHTTGTVNSGVLFSGSTDPGGWREMPADSDQWLMQHVPRYCLIGAFTLNDFPAPEEWFYMGPNWGSSRAPIAWRFPTSPPPSGTPEPWAGPSDEWRRLFLACNRPPPGPTGGGDGFWAVQLWIQELDADDVPSCAPPPDTRSAICQTQIDLIASSARTAQTACQAVAQDAADANAHSITLGIAVGVWSLVGIGLAVVTAGNFFASGEVQRALADVHAELWERLLALGAVGAVGVGASLAGALDPLLAVLAALLAVATAELCAEALAKAATLGWQTLLLVAAVCLVLLAALTVAIVQVGLLLSAARQHDADRATMLAAQSRWDDAMAGAFRFCCPSVVTSDPLLATQGFLTRPSCGAG